MRAIALCVAIIASMPVACSGGASAYHLLSDLADELDSVGAIVEVGSDRGEGSTSFLSALANRTHRPFFSVDFSEEGFLNARAACGSCAHQGMGEQWLEDEEGFAAAAAAEAGLRGGQTQQLVALAYLDNYDWTYPWTKTMSYKLQQHKDYQEQGLALSNAASQETHLRQAMAVEKRCSARCFVLFDDTWPGAAPGLYNGKGGRAVGFLLAKGFEVVQQSSEHEPSHLGWVLLRRLPPSERVVSEGEGAEEMWHVLRARMGVNGETEMDAYPTGTAVQVLSPAQHAVLGGSVLEIDVRVRGAVVGEHTLVVYNFNVEVLRVTHWDDMRTVRLPLCRADRASWTPSSAEPRKEQGGGEASVAQAGGVGPWVVCEGAEAAAAAGVDDGMGEEQALGRVDVGDGAVWVEHYYLPLVIHSMTPGNKWVELELVDALHTRVAYDSLRVNFLHPAQGTEL
jgi:hypothetical protein